jgi:hypothetical protein
MQENAQEALEIALANSRKTPLEFMLDAMNDESYLPGFRGEMAKAAAPFVHSKAPDAQPEKRVWPAFRPLDSRRNLGRERPQLGDGRRPRLFVAGPGGGVP